MQIEETQMYRVKTVARMLDVSRPQRSTEPSTQDLCAPFAWAAAKAPLRIQGHALKAYLLSVSMEVADVGHAA